MGFQRVVLSERYVINIPLSRSFCLLSACLCKARYTLATKSNSTRSTLLPVCSATTWIFMSHVMTQSLVTAFRYEDVVLASVSTIIAVAAARKRRRRVIAHVWCAILTLTRQCSLVFMKFQHCCRYGWLCRHTGPKPHGRDFQQSRPCWIQLSCQCVPGFRLHTR